MSTKCHDWVRTQDWVISGEIAPIQLHSIEILAKFAGVGVKMSSDLKIGDPYCGDTIRLGYNVRSGNIFSQRGSYRDDLETTPEQVIEALTNLIKQQSYVNQ